MVSRPPAVSVAIRAYRRRWLAAAIDSVLRQSWRDLELVIYDDAGDLEDIAASFADDRLRYVRAEKKLEASGRFAAAVALCRGNYIGVLDDDDRYEPRFVERLVAALENDPRAGAAFCREARESDGVRLQPPPPHPPARPAELLQRILVELSVPAPSSMLLRRAALEASETLQPMPDGVSPDVFVSFRLALGGWEQIFVDEILVVRGWHQERISASITGADYAVATFERLRTDDRALDQLRRRAVARCLISRAVHHLVAGRRHDALADLRAARAIDVSAHALLRRLAGIAARMPLLGPAAARAARGVRATALARAIPGCARP